MTVKRRRRSTLAAPATVPSDAPPPRVSSAELVGWIERYCFLAAPVVEPGKSSTIPMVVPPFMRRDLAGIFDNEAGTRRAILSHASHTGVARQSALEHVLFACDELAGFIAAISYVKPHRSVFEVDVASVKKKMKDKAFARSVNRQDIVEGAQELGVPLEEHIDVCVRAMQARADELGLRGNLEASAG